MLETEAPSLKPRVLWIEDDLKYAKLLGLELGHQFDFDVHPSLSPELCARIQQVEAPYDGIMIDMHLAQGRQGPEAFRQLRELGYKGPIFVLSNDETVISKLEMLALGVDDYLWKVMPTEELELRLKNTIQRYRQSFHGPVDPVSLGGLTMNLERLTATLHSEPLELSKLEFKILLTLFRHHPKPTGVETLKREAWESQSVKNGTLSTFFWKLNKKTEGWGYRIARSGDEVALKPA
jgi:DNA-binding response OmpR family regulator